MNVSLDNPLLVVAHDAGGAEVIAAWIRRHFRQPYACVAEGPAKRIFEAIPSTGISMLRRDEALARLQEFRTLLAGSSWSSDLEKTFIRSANRFALRTITYLDHWTDFRERFLFQGRLAMPREVWVADEHAEGIMRSSFPGQDVRNVGNYYLAEIVEQIRVRSFAGTSNTDKKHVLYVSEPVGAAAERKYGDKNHYGYTEYDSIDAFLVHARTHWSRKVGSLRIRRHPSEEIGKFAAYVNAGSEFPIEECGDLPLVVDCAWADWIVGCQSMALVAGLMAGKRVFSAIPRGGKAMQIPYPGIVQLFQTSANVAECTRGSMS